MRKALCMLAGVFVFTNCAHTRQFSILAVSPTREGVAIVAERWVDDQLYECDFTKASCTTIQVPLKKRSAVAEFFSARGDYPQATYTKNGSILATTPEFFIAIPAFVVPAQLNVRQANHILRVLPESGNAEELKMIPQPKVLKIGVEVKS